MFYDRGVVHLGAFLAEISLHLLFRFKGGTIEPILNPVKELGIKRLGVQTPKDFLLAVATTPIV